MSCTAWIGVKIFCSSLHRYAAAPTNHHNGLSCIQHFLSTYSPEQQQSGTGSDVDLNGKCTPEWITFNASPAASIIVELQLAGFATWSKMPAYVQCNLKRRLFWYRVYLLRLSHSLEKSSSIRFISNERFHRLYVVPDLARKVQYADTMATYADCDAPQWSNFTEPQKLVETGAKIMQ